MSREKWQTGSVFRFLFFLFTWKRLCSQWGSVGLPLKRWWFQSSVIWVKSRLVSQIAALEKHFLDKSRTGYNLTNWVLGNRNVGQCDAEQRTHFCQQLQCSECSKVGLTTFEPDAGTFGYSPSHQCGYNRRKLLAAVCTFCSMMHLLVTLGM